MNEQQREIVNSFGQGLAVTAGAGCGKTTTLVAKCIQLLKQNPKARFCAVSFTEKSVRDLQSSLQKGFLEAKFDLQTVRDLKRNHWIKTIHGLCLSLIQEFPLEAGLLGGERIILEDEAQSLWNRSLYLLWTRNENREISESLERLLSVYSRRQLEMNFRQLKNLHSYGVQSWMEKGMKDRVELRDFWLVFLSVFDRFQQWKRKSGVLDFNDLERFAAIALRHPRVRAHYQERFDLVMVDEFQDTNPLQGEILVQFVKPDLSNFCVVGDPKQSIYRFRDADVSVFQDLCEQLPVRKPLDINYRSDPAIIDFVNRVCEPLFQASELSYDPLQPGLESNPEISQPVVRLLLDSESSLASFLQDRASEGTDLSEYVILFRSISKEKTQRYLNVLDQFQIPYLLGSGGRFYQDPRVKELVAFLRGWSSKNHRLSQVTALRAPWIGISDRELLSWRENFFDSFFTHSRHPISLALRESYFSSEALRPGELLEKIWEVLPPESEMLMSLASLWQKVEQLSSQGFRFEEVVHQLFLFMDQGKIESEIPPPAEKGMVRIMTIHAAKGLQFPRVILLDFDGPYYKPNQSVDFIWNRKQGIHLLYRDEDGDRDKKNPENLKWTELENQASVAESKRLFYVAITRPQRQLILGWKKEVKESKTKAPTLLDDHWRHWVQANSPAGIQDLEVDPEPKGISAVNPVSATDSGKPSRISYDPSPYRPRHSPSEWMILNQCPLRYRNLFHAPELESESPVPIQGNHHSGENIMEKGIRVHRAIELEDWNALATEFDRPEVAKKVIQNLEPLLTRSRENEGWKIFKELAFEIPFSGDEAMVGVMDRMEIHPETGALRILDYKWTQSKRTPAELKIQYELQLELYVWAALQLCGPHFQLKSLETCLIHFSPDGMEAIPVDISRGSLQEQVTNLLEMARDISKGREPEARLGSHCQYCEFQENCDLYRNNKTH